MMRIFDELLCNVPPDATIQDVAIGIFWIYVRTQYASALSATAHRWIEDPPGSIIPQAGSLVGSKVRALAPLYDSPSLTARSLANAAVSASFAPNAMTGTKVPGSAQDLVAHMCQRATKKRHIALIGHFHFADKLRAMGHTLDVFELEGRLQPGDIPSSQFPQRLPTADIVLLTSSTLLTHATESILALCAPNAQKLIVGPSVPLHPLLWKYGATAVCGNIITDDTQVCRAIREGANHKQLSGCLKVNYLLQS